MNRKKLIIGLVIVIGLAAVIYANLNTNRSTGVEVETEKIARHDLEAIVSASGKIRPQRSVNVSAETMGKVVGLAVNEGDVVTQGQFLLQIDPPLEPAGRAYADNARRFGQNQFRRGSPVTFD